MNKMCNLENCDQNDVSRSSVFPTDQDLFLAGALALPQTLILANVKLAQAQAAKGVSINQPQMVARSAPIWPICHWPVDISQNPCKSHQIDGRFLKLVMATIAKRGFCRGFTSTEKHLFGCRGGNFYRRNACILVAAIAKRLFGTFATGTPEIGFAFFNFDWHW